MEKLNRILIPYKDVVFAINLTKVGGKFYIECFEKLSSKENGTENICIIGELWDELNIIAQASTGLSVTEYELERWHGLIYTI